MRHSYRHPHTIPSFKLILSYHKHILLTYMKIIMTSKMKREIYTCCLCQLGLKTLWRWLYVLIQIHSLYLTVEDMLIVKNMENWHESLHKHMPFFPADGANASATLIVYVCVPFSRAVGECCRSRRYFFHLIRTVFFRSGILWLSLD